MGGTLILSPAQAKTGATPSSETRTLHENGAPANRKQGVQEFSGVPCKKNKKSWWKKAQRFMLDGTQLTKLKN